jgi:hypothetical protein
MKKNKKSSITPPRTRVLARITDGLRESDVVHFPTPEMKALYFSARAESPSCWPRVLEGKMTQERFNERQKRMMAAILAATA